MIAMFPNIAVSVEDLYWMGNPRDGYLVSIRWGAVGSHRGNGPTESRLVGRPISGASPSG